MRVIPIISFQNTYTPELSTKKIVPILTKIKMDKNETNVTVKRGAIWTNNNQNTPIPSEIAKPIFTESNIAKMFCFDYKFAVLMSFY
jgi:hypothetical protein